MTTILTRRTSPINEDHRHAIIIPSTSSNSGRSESGLDNYRDSGTSSPQPNENGVTKILSSSSIIRQTSNNNSQTNDFNDDSDSNDSVFSTSSSMDDDSSLEVRDIYLGGSCMLRTTWRRDIAIPLLKSRNITFYLPTIHENLALKEAKKSKGYKLEELEHSSSEALMYSPRILDSSRVLLFVITNETRSLAPMTLAAHYIGLAYNVVLCIQMLPDKDCKIGIEKVSFICFDFNACNSIIYFYSLHRWPSRITIVVALT